MKNEIARRSGAVLLALLGNYAEAPAADLASSSGPAAPASGFLIIIGAVWVFGALIFVFSLARAAARTMIPSDSTHHRWSAPVVGLVLLVFHCAAAEADPFSGNRMLIIDPSSMPITAGKATLVIGVLHRTNGVYSGEYKMDVSPYFFKNETGRLAIVVSDESLAKVGQGKVVAIIGTAISPGGKARPIAATATPTGSEGGKLKLWFTAGERRMVFEPAYRFAERSSVNGN
jgi:hypothetical protein